MSQQRNQNNPSARPILPESYGISQQREGLLPWTFVDTRMAEARNYWLATASPNRRPHVSPVWGLWLNGIFYFATDSDSRKARNLSYNHMASVHLESGDEVVILEGMVSKVQEPGLILKLNEQYLAKYNVNLTGNPIHQLIPEKALAWREPDFPSTATRWLFSDDESN